MPLLLALVVLVSVPMELSAVTCRTAAAPVAAWAPFGRPREQTTKRTSLTDRRGGRPASSSR
uniref:Secreted protein n=1 Tax=Zea mays TaxID=4577 RepID=B6TPH9_MAIZE|nr:hypothetical protein [Zea mays]